MYTELFDLPSVSGWTPKVVAAEIDGREGGTLVLEDSYEADEGGALVEIQATLVIPEGAFEGSATISLSTDPEKAAFVVQPNGKQFDVDLLLTGSITGLELSEEQEVEVGFGFYNEALEQLEECNANQVNSSIEEGSLSVVDAEISHFSRYGWAK